MRSTLQWFIAVFVLLFCARGIANGPREIIGKAIEAAGGREVLSKYKKPVVRVQEGKVFGGSGPFAITLRLTEWFPDRMRSEQETLREGAKVVAVEGCNGVKGWRTIEAATEGRREPKYKVVEMDEATLQEVHNRIYTHWIATLLPLDDAAFRLSVLDESAVDNRPAVGITVAREERPDVHLYFDKETFVILKLARRSRDRLVEECYSNYAKVDGLVYPKTTVVRRDGRKVVETETTEFKFIDAPDVSVFDKL